MRVILIALLLTSCGFEPTLFNLKMAADGVSYAATGKTTNDNVASAVTHKDCDTFNLLEKDKAYCRVKVSYNPPPRNGLKVTWVKRPKLK